MEADGHDRKRATATASPSSVMIMMRRKSINYHWILCAPVLRSISASFATSLAGSARIYRFGNGFVTLGEGCEQQPELVLLAFDRL